jgi:hypothetical protein
MFLQWNDIPYYFFKTSVALYAKKEAPALTPNNCFVTLVFILTPLQGRKIIRLRLLFFGLYCILQKLQFFQF